MFDMLTKNPRLAEGVLGGLLRMIPPDAWKQFGGELAKITAVAQSIDDRMKRIEEMLTADRAKLDLLETICRSGIPDSGVFFAEWDMYHPDKRTHVGGIPIAEIAKPEKPANVG